MHPEASESGLEPVHHRWRGRARLRDVRTLNLFQKTVLHVAAAALFGIIIVVAGSLLLRQPVGSVVDPEAMCPIECRQLNGCVLGSPVRVCACGLHRWARSFRP
jgi:hypothetical protein